MSTYASFKEAVESKFGYLNPNDFKEANVGDISDMSHADLHVLEDEIKDRITKLQIQRKVNDEDICRLAYVNNMLIEWEESYLNLLREAMKKNNMPFYEV